MEEEKVHNPFKRSPIIPIDNVGDEHSYRPKKGVSKKILEVGTGTLLPKTPSIVKVIYKGYITATKELFDTSNEQVVEITLGDKEYPEGFIAGVESMKKGERSEIKMTRKYGFKEGLIPEKLKDKEVKGKGLTYEVKLIDATIKMDLNGDRKIIKTVVKEGAIGEVPNEADEVKGKYTNKN